MGINEDVAHLWDELEKEQEVPKNPEPEPKTYHPRKKPRGISTPLSGTEHSWAKTLLQEFDKKSILAQMSEQRASAIAAQEGAWRRKTKKE